MFKEITYVNGDRTIKAKLSIHTSEYHFYFGEVLEEAHFLTSYCDFTEFLRKAKEFLGRDMFECKESAMFKVGDKVTCARFEGVGEVVEIVETIDTYPVKVMYGFSTFSFTRDGRYYVDSLVSLFHVKEEPTVEKVTVTIQVLKDFEITKAERNLVLDLVGLRPTAVEFIRRQYDLSFDDARSICDKIWETPQ